MLRDVRSAPRIQVTIPTLVEKIGQHPVSPDLSLAPYYERVTAEPSGVGMKVPGIVQDLSVNGAFIAAYPFPLLSRVAFTFPLPAFGQVDAIGWVFWRRSSDASLQADGAQKELPAGIGVLFEALSVDARVAIARLVSRAVVRHPDPDHHGF